MLLFDSKGLMQVRSAASALIKAFLFVSALLVSTGIYATETILVGADAEWRYYSSPTPPPENWKAPAFDASSWSAGHAQLGYGDGDEATVIPGGDLNPHPVAAYFRRSFSVTTPATLSKLVLRLLRDDGAVVYVNGVEVLRSNMPDGVITPDTLAATTVGADIENQFLTYEVPTTALVTGENIVAVEVHQANVTSSDLSFALQIIGATGDTPPQPVVSIVAAQPATREADANLRTAPGKFVVSRTGNQDSSLTVYLRYEGTATAGSDYGELPMKIDFASGESSRELSVIPVSDFVKEPTETVVARLS